MLPASSAERRALYVGGSNPDPPSLWRSPPGLPCSSFSSSESSSVSSFRFEGAVQRELARMQDKYEVIVYSEGILGLAGYL